MEEFILMYDAGRGSTVDIMRHISDATDEIAETGVLHL